MSQSSPPLEPGLVATFERVVPPEWTLTHYDPSLPPIFSTPAMIGMMEVAASLAIIPSLPPDSISVGTRVEVDHLKAAPLGATIVAYAKLAEIDGRALIFTVEALNGTEVIGRGRVFRAIVDRTRFMGKFTRHQ